MLIKINRNLVDKDILYPLRLKLSKPEEKKINRRIK